MIDFLPPATPWRWATLVIIVALGVLLIYRYRKQPAPLIAGWITLLGLLALAWQPGRTVVVNTRDAILLTPNANPKVIDSLSRMLPDAPQLALPRVVTQTAELVDPLHLPVTHPTVGRLHVVGDGLPIWLLDLWNGPELLMHLNPKPEGILTIDYTPQVVEGDTLALRGTWNKVNPGKSLLELRGPSGSITLAEPDTPGTYAFFHKLSAPPAGRYLWNLHLDSLDHPLPVEVTDRPRPRLLLLGGSPDFETKYLKNWLGDQGYRLATRFVVSRDRYLTEWINQSRGDLEPLTLNRLEQFDLLLLSADYWTELASDEQAVLTRANREGLGLLLLKTSTTLRLPGILRAFELQPSAPKYQLPGIELELEKPPLQIRSSNRLFPLYTSTSGEVIGAWKPNGKGRLGLIVGGNTFPLLLYDELAAYARLWRTPITTLARSFEEPPPLEAPFPIVTGQLTTFHWRTGLETPNVQWIDPSGDTINFPPRQGVLESDRWSVPAVPQQAGWHQLQSGEAAAWFYATGDEDWLALRRHERLVANRTAGDDQNVVPVVPTQWRPYPLWWWFGLSLLGLTVRWIWEKVRI